MRMVNLRVLVEFLQMTVSQFSREADIVAHHRIQGSFILAESGIEERITPNPAARAAHSRTDIPRTC